MKTIIFGFIKRAVVIPLVITALCFGAIYFVINMYNDKFEAAQSAQPTYQTVTFDNFSQLSEGDCIGKISISEYENGITYGDSTDDSLYLGKNSGEPWNGGSIFIFGNSAPKQLGDHTWLTNNRKVSVEFFSGDKYTYEITGVKYGLKSDDIAKLGGKNKLYICHSYNDFSNSGSSVFYAVYTADMAGEDA